MSGQNLIQNSQGLLAVIRTPTEEQLLREAIEAIRLNYSNQLNMVMSKPINWAKLPKTEALIMIYVEDVSGSMSSVIRTVAEADNMMNEELGKGPMARSTIVIGITFNEGIAILYAPTLLKNAPQVTASSQEASDKGIPLLTAGGDTALNTALIFAHLVGMGLAFEAGRAGINTKVVIFGLTDEGQNAGGLSEAHLRVVRDLAIRTQIAHSGIAHIGHSGGSRWWANAAGYKPGDVRDVNGTREALIDLARSVSQRVSNHLSLGGTSVEEDFYPPANAQQLSGWPAGGQLWPGGNAGNAVEILRTEVMTAMGQIDPAELAKLYVAIEKGDDLTSLPYYSSIEHLAESDGSFSYETLQMFMTEIYHFLGWDQNAGTP